MRTRPRQLDARLVDQRGLSQEKMLKDLVTRFLLVVLKKTLKLLF